MKGKMRVKYLFRKDFDQDNIYQRENGRDVLAMKKVLNLLQT